eukprot:gene38625-46955_t
MRLSASAQCSCLPCLQSTSRVHFVQSGRGDGFGSALQHVLFSMAYSFYHGWHYAGVCKFRSKHGVHAKRVYDLFFGNYRNVDGLAVRRKIAQNKFPDATVIPIANFTSLLSITPHLQLFHDETSLTILDYESSAVPVDVEEYVSKYLSSPAFLNSLRMGAGCGVAKQLASRSYFVQRGGEQQLRVAIHIRLGDVWESEKYHHRLTNFSWYSDMIENIQLLHPNAQIHVFSSYIRHLNYTVHPRELLGKALSSYSRNITVHMDDEDSKDATEDMLSAMAHLMTADVLVMARSAFSYISAMLNPNCVFVTPLPLFPSLPSWLVPPPAAANDSALLKDFLRSNLTECIQRLHLGSSLTE